MDTSCREFNGTPRCMYVYEFFFLCFSNICLILDQSSYSSGYYSDSADPEPDQYTVNLLGSKVNNLLGSKVNNLLGYKVYNLQGTRYTTSGVQGVQPPGYKVFNLQGTRYTTSRVQGIQPPRVQGVQAMYTPKHLDKDKQVKLI